MLPGLLGVLGATQLYQKTQEGENEQFLKELAQRKSAARKVDEMSAEEAKANAQRILRKWEAERGLKERAESLKMKEKVELNKKDKK